MRLASALYVCLNVSCVCLRQRRCRFCSAIHVCLTVSCVSIACVLPRGRLQVATFEDRKWIPRLEILAKTLHLRTFEKHVLVLLVREYLMSRYLGSASSGLGEQTDRVNFYRSLSPRCSTTRRFDIKTLCAYFSVTFTEQLQVGGLVGG